MTRPSALALVLALATRPGVAAAEAPLILGEQERARVQAVATEMICHCGCPRETVADCVCGMADDIRRDIWRDLQGGKSPAEVLDAYVAEHGEEFRSMPRKQGLGLVAWGLPWASMLVAAGVLLPVVRRWSRPGAPLPPAAPLEDGLDARIDKEVHDLD